MSYRTRLIDAYRREEVTEVFEGDELSSKDPLQTTTTTSTAACLYIFNHSQSINDGRNISFGQFHQPKQKFADTLLKRSHSVLPTFVLKIY
jgi:hypothetical protein